MKILVIDDSNTMRRIVTNTLKQLGGHEVLEASDGIEGLVQLQNARDIGLILTDFNMPNLNGLDFLTRVRKTNKTIPIVMMTTEAEKASLARDQSVAVSNYVVKPLTPATLKEKIGSFLTA